MQISEVDAKQTACNVMIFRLVIAMSENRVLRRVFGAKRDEVTGEWRKLQNEELSDL